jgi:hypothetical protein
MIDEYVVILEALYNAIRLVSDADTIIEISKDPTFCCLLARMPRHDVRAVHLVRDSRAVAYSWTRQRRELSPIGGRQFMPRFSPIETASKWVAFDAGLRAMSRTGVPYTEVTYEALLAEPRRVLIELQQFADLDTDVDISIVDGHVQLSEHHMFSGNPMRASNGRIPLCVDDEWRDRLPPRQFAAVTALTWPLLRRYGYSLARRRPPSMLASERRDELAHT